MPMGSRRMRGRIASSLRSSRAVSSGPGVSVAPRATDTARARASQVQLSEPPSVVRVLGSARKCARRAAPRDADARRVAGRVARVRSARVGRQPTPAVAGSYRVTADAIEFTPAFAFDPGRRYEVVFDPARFPASIEWPGSGVCESSAVAGDRPRAGRPTTSVAGIYPSADVVPENQLRLYVHFSAPMGRQGGTGVHPPAGRQARASGRSIPAARRGVLERRPHAVHGVLRSGPSEARASCRTSRWAERWSRPRATRWSSTRRGATRRACRSRHLRTRISCRPA